MAVGAWLAAAPGGWDRALLLQLILIVMPFMVTVCLLALGSAALHCKGHFAYPAFAPILLNLVLIAAAATAHRVVGGNWRGLFLLAGAVVAAGVVQVAGVVWLLRSVKLAALPRLRPVLGPVRQMARLMLPMMVPLSIVQLSALFDGLYAWGMTATAERPSFEAFGVTIHKPLSAGVVTCVYAADRLYHFPMGILALSVATVTFPLLSRYAARGDLAGFRETTNRALRLSVFLGLPAGVGLILLARPAIALIFRHGRFSAADVSRAALVLRMYCLGMWAYFARHILLRAFFAQKVTRAPLRVSIVCALANVALVATLVFTPLRAGAIGLATAATSTANVVVLVWILRRRWGRLGLKRVAASGLRTAAATAVMAGAALLAARLARPAGQTLAQRWRVSWAAPGAVVLAAIAAGTAAFFLAAVALRCAELCELRGLADRP
jgi:putative peptidoglycan lipid II flippase